MPAPSASTSLPVPSHARPYRWIANGVEFKTKLLEVLNEAVRSIRLETYIYSDDTMGGEVLSALVLAARRGVTVRVLVDAVGSIRLPAGYWQPLVQAGGDARTFNPIALRRLPIRNHRKLVVVDDEVAGVGGFNVADVYTGDGITSGWADLGLATREPAVVSALARSFDRVFDSAGVVQPQAFIARLRRGQRPPAEHLSSTAQLLANGPGRSASAFQLSLRADVRRSRDVRLISAYFLPTYTMRRLLGSVARGGGRVQIIVPGQSDVAVAHRAAQFLYQRLMQSGVEIWEYQPQILHAKLFVVDGAVYVGSSNLDTRSLHINFELMLRITERDTVAAGNAIFERMLQHSRQIDPATWRTSRNWLERQRERWAYWLLSRADPYVARWLVLGPR